MSSDHDSVNQKWWAGHRTDSASSGGVTLRRTKDARHVLAICEAFEPRSALICATMLDRGARRSARAWVARTAVGSPAGVVVAHRIALDRWRAYVLVLADEAGPVLGRLVERSPAAVLTGSERDVRAVVAHVPRAGVVRTAATYSFSASKVQTIAPTLTDASPAARFAVPGDESALMALMARYEYNNLPTRRRLRRLVSRQVRDGRVVVFDNDRTVIGALVIGGASRRFLTLEAVTVLPTERGQGTTIAMMMRVAEYAYARRLGVFWAHAATNHTNLGQWAPLMERARADEWATVTLRPGRRFPGHNRLRRLLVRLEGGPAAARP